MKASNRKHWLPLDASATVTNPAGMTQNTRRLDVGLTYFDPDNHFRAVVITCFFGVGDTRELGTQNSASWMTHLGLVYPLNSNWPLGVGGYGIFGMGVYYPASLYSNRVYTRSQLLKIAPAVSPKIGQQFSLGFMLNINYGVMGLDVGRSMTTGPTVLYYEQSQIGRGFSLDDLWGINQTVQAGFPCIRKQWLDDFEFNTVHGKGSLYFDLPKIITSGLGIKPNRRWRTALEICGSIGTAPWGRASPNGPRTAPNPAFGAWTGLISESLPPALSSI